MRFLDDKNTFHNTALVHLIKLLCDPSLNVFNTKSVSIFVFGVEELRKLTFPHGETRKLQGVSQFYLLL